MYIVIRYYTYIYIYIYIYMVPCPMFPPPPWDGGGMMPLWWCIYIHTYLHTYLPTYIPTYIHTYIPLHYLTLPYLTLHYLALHSIHTYIPTITLHYLTLHYLTLPYITLPYIPYIHTYTHTYIHTYIHTYTHTYIHTYIHTYQHTYQHTNIPTYHHHRPQGGGPEEPYHHHRPQGGGDQKNHTTTTGHRGGARRTRRYCPPIPIGGGGRGGGQRCTIYTKTIPNQTSKFLLECSGLTTSTAWPTRTATFNSFISSRHLTVTHGTVQTCQYRQVFRVISSHIESYRVMFILSILSYWCTVGTLKYTQILDSSELRIFRMWFHAFPQFASPHRLLSAILVAWPVPRCTRGSGFYPE